MKVPILRCGIQNKCWELKYKAARDLEPVVHSLDRFYGLDPSLPKLHLDEVEELKTADDNVKKMFSLEFASNAEIKQYKSYKLMQELKEKIGLESTASKNVLPLRIARLTMAVRNCGKHVIKNPKDKANKRKMLINIDRRRKYLKRLRGRNYGHFEKIEEELGIKWVPIPKYNKRKSKRQIEQEAIKDKAHWDRIAAKQEFERKRNEENMIEIVRLKKELGKELTEEEKHFDNK
ncbi:small ribosomal subunit protein uS15m-like isoform X2 [Antedon mediterranea]|uniref:small ribosomal subunit protein uS15m-like isoform X2 n=1 Tax=Antedon mediterranea TaxID=105859 RepID=UPI003AF4559D